MEKWSEQEQVWDYIRNKGTNWGGYFLVRGGYNALHLTMHFPLHLELPLHLNSQLGCDYFSN